MFFDSLRDYCDFFWRIIVLLEKTHRISSAYQRMRFSSFILLPSSNIMEYASRVNNFFPHDHTVKFVLLHPIQENAILKHKYVSNTGDINHMFECMFAIYSLLF